jgi:hypothetical protein
MALCKNKIYSFYSINPTTKNCTYGINNNGRKGKGEEGEEERRQILEIRDNTAVFS